ncbi:MAG: acyl carrier protein [Alphaproteobacteria bacterium]|nr:acyl carrier protein [Alphaproteobacteria bacterium]MBV9154077.1 acyl carrier protein [Alphaproteobacteria bacterium]MBV9967676.1 acyl carrier protein [Alphaproteobacteria bacterium]
MSLRSTIMSQFEEVANEQGKRLAPLNDSTLLLDSGLDSLCLAIIVARLEGDLGLDPFQTAPEDKFPITFGDFVKLYQSAAA